MTNASKTPVQNTKNFTAPFIFMVILMALIGFITGMNQQFQEPLKNLYLHDAEQAKNTLSTLLVFFFFLAYFVMGPMASKYLNKNGYKRTLLFGILVVALSMLFFEASALIFSWAGGEAATDGLNKMHIMGITLPLSYFIFLIGSFVAGTGLTFLQSSVNPYLVVCTVPHTTGVTRQNIGGVGNSIMTTFTPMFVSVVIFHGIAADKLKIEQTFVPFLVLFVLLILLYFAVAAIKLPHLEGTTDATNTNIKHTVLRYRHLVLGTVAIGVYVGCEVCVGANMVTAWTQQYGPDTYKTATLWSTFYWGAMLVGRFFSSFLSKVSAQKQLTIATIIAALFLLVSMITRKLEFLALVGLAHSVMWGAIFALALEGLGKYTALASGVLLMGLIGGAILPFFHGLLADYLGGWHYTWILVIAGELYMLYYALIGHKVIEPKNIQ